MKGRCYGCGSTGHVKKDCPYRSGSSATTTDPKKVAKVKNAAKPSAPKSSGDQAKVEPEKSLAAVDTASAADSQAEPMPLGRCLRRRLEEFLRSGLLKSIRGLKALRAEDAVGCGVKPQVRIKSVNEAQFGLPGQYALLDGGATHALR
eukprot:s4094_g5.t1